MYDSLLVAYFSNLAAGILCTAITTINIRALS